MLDLCCHWVITRPNPLSQTELKYGDTVGEDRFFYWQAVIDACDRMIIAYHLGLGTQDPLHEGVEAIPPPPCESFGFSLFWITQTLKAMSKFRVRGLNPNPADPLFFPHSASQGMRH